MNCKIVKQINIVQFLIQLGRKPVVRKNNAVWFKLPLPLENTASFKVEEKKNFWLDFGEGIGGTLMDLVLNILKTNNVSEALRFIEKHSIFALGRKKLSSFPKQNANVSVQYSDKGIQFSILNSPMLRGFNVLKSNSDFRLFMDNDSTGIQATKMLYFSFPKANRISHQFKEFTDLNEFVINSKTYFKIE